MTKAFVKVVVPEEGSGTKGLYYRVVRANNEGQLVDVLEPYVYPWYWGFASMKNALKVAANYNDEYDTGWATAVIAKKLGDQERKVNLEPTGAPS